MDPRITKGVLHASRAMNSPVKQTFFSPGYRQGHQGLERLTDLPRATHLVSEGASTQNQAVCRSRILGRLALHCSNQFIKGQQLKLLRNPKGYIAHIVCLDSVGRDSGDDA